MQASHSADPKACVVVLVHGCYVRRGCYVRLSVFSWTLALNPEDFTLYNYKRYCMIPKPQFTSEPPKTYTLRGEYPSSVALGKALNMEDVWPTGEVSCHVEVRGFSQARAP